MNSISREGGEERATGDSSHAIASGPDSGALRLNESARGLVARAAPSEAPELVPARMINETLYCERLLYLEWAQGEFEDNAFTVDGRASHRRADAPGGSLPEPPREATPPVAGALEGGGTPMDAPPDALPFKARSVWLSSDRLGITAKIDVLEGEGGEVAPIEYKRGTAPDLPEGAYLPERAQVCAQVLLLREHGYRCDRGEIYFAGSRRRVAIAIDDALIATTLGAARRARAIAAGGTIPPPLVDSPKCNGCSLVGICLPDEVNLLRALDGDAPGTEDGEEGTPQLAFAFAPSSAMPVARRSTAYTRKG